MSTRGDSPSLGGKKASGGPSGGGGACYVLLVEQMGRTLQSIRSSSSQRLHSDLSVDRQNRRNLCLPGTVFREAEEKDVIDCYNPTRSKTTLVLRSFETSDLYICCSGAEDVERITYDELCLLLGVTSCSDRLRILRDKMLLEELKQLQMGDNVFVVVNNSEELEGFLRYKGPISSLEPATIFGVELDKNPGCGNSSGSHQNRLYFQVAHNCATFVGAHRIVASRHSPRHRANDSGGSDCSCSSNDRNNQQQRRQSAHSTPLAIGERIVWMADNGPEFGTVRWIGILEDVSEDWTVGVEFDHAVGTGTGKYRNEQLFRARMNHASLIPVMGLVKEADFLGTHSSSSTIATANSKVLSGNVGGGNVIANLPVFNEVQLDLVADRISKYDWPVVANHLKIPPNMLGDVGIITILRWWWQSGCMSSSGASSRLSLLVEALAAAGRYAFAAELKSSFTPDQFRTNSGGAAMTNATSFGNGIESNQNQDSPLMDPDHLRSNERLMREQEIVLNQARQHSNTNGNTDASNSLSRGYHKHHHHHQQHHQQSSSPPQQQQTTMSRDNNERYPLPASSRSPHLGVDDGADVVEGADQSPTGAGNSLVGQSASAVVDQSASLSSSSMNPLYDLSSLSGFVPATQIMDERERKNKVMFATSSASAVTGTPRAARQARATTLAPTTTAQQQPAASINGRAATGASPGRYAYNDDNDHDGDLTNDAAMECGRPAAEERFAAAAAESSTLWSATSSTKLEVGSLVEVDLSPQQNQFGVIRWIGNIAKSDNRLCQAAGLEMDEEDQSYTDGVFQTVRYFSCAPNRALFIPLSRCKLDSRFQDVVDGAALLDSEIENDMSFGEKDSPIVAGDIPPPAQVDLDLVSGNFKGIQGHHNSCYLDATLFSMFAFSSVFDQVLYRPPQTADIPQYKEIQRVLKECIVNPLRRHFFVRADRTMQLRRLLDRLSDVDGMMGEEKDPEEFLRSLLEQTLKMEPLIKLTSDQKAYFYQIFVEKDDSLVVPTIQQLFEKSMFQSDLRFTQAPACLIIQMPRYGKDFKMFKRIIPSLELDISDVIANSPRECNVCRNPAHYECRDCYRATSPPIPLRFTAYCDKCMADHQYRAPNDLTPRHDDHVRLSIPAAFKKLRSSAPQRRIPRISMELFAVLCIHTSHYVAFVKAGGRKSYARMQEMLASLDPELARGCGNGLSQKQRAEDDGQWLFFDSMAGRVGLKNGYNIPRVIYVEDFTEWASDEKRDIIEDSLGNDRVLPEHIVRLLGDAYMCFYQDPYQIDAL